MMKIRTRITEYDKHLFRIAHNLRQPKPGDNWNKFHIETKNMLIVFISEETSLKANEIADMFGMKGNNRTVIVARDEINPETYKEFKMQLSDIMELHRLSMLSSNGRAELKNFD